MSTGDKKCTHINQRGDIISPAQFKMYYEPTCPDCKKIDGMIMCLVCGHLLCMKEDCPNVKGRMSHYAETGHRVDMKLTLLKPYCWKCMSTAENELLTDLVNRAYQLIHGTPKPADPPKLDYDKILASIGSFESNWKNFQDRFDEVLKGCLGFTNFENCTLSNIEKLSVLDGSVTLENVMKRLGNGEYTNVLVMVGAGISTSANIPDFRTPGSGLYDNLAKYKLPKPEAIFDLEYFDTVGPEAFFQLAADLFPGTKYKPTPTHRFIKLLQDKGVLKRCYTQNIDGLERIAGISDDLLVEAHGTFASSTCRQCKKTYPGDRYKADIVKGRVPVCFKCSGVVKPDIVFFGEELPQRFKDLYKDDFEACDLLIVIGTSLQVAPFAHLVGQVKQTVPRVLVNREVVGNSLVSGGNRFDFSPETGYRDVFLEGLCDSGVQQMAKHAGWERDLAASNP